MIEIQNLFYINTISSILYPLSSKFSKGSKVVHFKRSIFISIHSGFRELPNTGRKYDTHHKSWSEE